LRPPLDEQRLAQAAVEVTTELVKTVPDIWLKSEKHPSENKKGKGKSHF
jgi:hypothetical protein